MKIVSLFTKLRGYRIIFDDPTVKKKSIETLLGFFQDSMHNTLEVSNVIVYLRWHENGKKKTTERVTRICKVSEWTVLDRFCYMIWFPWGIRQRYRVDTIDGRHYLVRFSEQSFNGFDLFEKILFEDES